jgi:hypothetical protein
MSGKKPIRVDMKKIFQDREKRKGFFGSFGISTIKKSFINDKGQQDYELIEIPIRPVSNDTIVRKFNEVCPRPKPEIKRQLINLTTGESAAELNKSVDEVRNNPAYGWAEVYKTKDEAFLKLDGEWQAKLMTLYVAIAFDMADLIDVSSKEALEKSLKEFEEFLEDVGISKNQMEKIGDDIKALDTL